LRPTIDASNRLPDRRFFVGDMSVAQVEERQKLGHIGGRLTVAVKTT
jgi:hypothetical protein